MSLPQSAELSKLCARHEKEREKLSQQMEDLKAETELLNQRISKMQCRMFSINGPVSEYAFQIKKVSRSIVDSSYILRLQSQLCKSLHCWGMILHQLELVKQGYEEEVDILKRARNKTNEAKCKAEIDLINRLACLDNEKRALEEQHEKDLQEQCNLIEKIAEEHDKARPLEEVNTEKMKGRESKLNEEWMRFKEKTPLLKMIASLDTSQTDYKDRNEKSNSASMHPTEIGQSFCPPFKSKYGRAA